MNRSMDRNHGASDGDGQDSALSRMRVSLRQEQRVWIEKEAARRGVANNVIMRELVENALSGQTGVPPQPSSVPPVSRSSSRVPGAGVLEAVLVDSPLARSDGVDSGCGAGGGAFVEEEPLPDELPAGVPPVPRLRLRLLLVLRALPAPMAGRIRIPGGPGGRRSPFGWCSISASGFRRAGGPSGSVGRRPVDCSSWCGSRHPSSAGCRSQSRSRCCGFGCPHGRDRPTASRRSRGSAPWHVDIACALGRRCCFGVGHRRDASGSSCPRGSSCRSGSARFVREAGSGCWVRLFRVRRPGLECVSCWVDGICDSCGDPVFRLSGVDPGGEPLSVPRGPGRPGAESVLPD